jgi:mannosyltransferase
MLRATTEVADVGAEARLEQPVRRASRRPRLGALRYSYVLWALIGVGIAIRFSTLSTQSFNYDELQTAHLVNEPFGTMLRGIADVESTPPLYYVLAFGWSKVFGAGEAGLRAFSALCGVAGIGAIFLAAREAGARAAGLLAAALASLSPWLIWYSQEARAYALTFALAAASFWLFLRLINDPRPRVFVAWSVVSAFALASHYFAVFVVAPEAVLLIAATGPRRRVWLAVAAVAATGAALLPLANYQRGQGHGDEMIAISGSLPLRVAQLPKQSLVGYDAPAEKLVAAVAIALVLYAAVRLATLADARERRVARMPAIVAAAGVAVPVALAVVGLDYVVARNVIAVLAPAWITVAIGLWTCRGRRSGALAAGALLALLGTVTVAIASNPDYQRDDWRGAARSLGPATVDRALVITPPAPPGGFAVYASGVRWLPSGGAKVREIDLVGIANSVGRAGHGRAAVRAVAAPPVPGFVEIARAQGATFATVRFRAPRPLLVRPAQLRRHTVQPDEEGTVFFQPHANAVR